MIHLFFLIRDLDSGGAQRQLTELVKKLDKTRFRVTVATFYDGGRLRSEIEGIDGVKVVSLNKKGRWDVVPFLARLARVVFEEKPEIVHGYMGVANELSLIVGRIAGAKVVWGFRASYMDLSQYDWLASVTGAIGTWFSRFPDLMIINSYDGKRRHTTSGRQNNRMIVIHNGIDTKRFEPDHERGSKRRYEWGISENQQLIGLVGRLDPMKDHPTFLQAAAMLAQERSSARFVCIGDGPASYKRELQTLAEELGVARCLTWAGGLNNVRDAYNALDILTSASYGESFPNVIGEAMACGIPCIVTDVGDSALIVGDTGYVVPAKNPAALKTAWAKFLDLPIEQRAELGKKARERILNNFTVQHLVNQTQSALVSLL